MDEGTTRIVQLKGHNYFVVDQDVTKGDRRSDGPALSSFFLVEAGSTNVNNVRQSHRIKKKMEEPPMVNRVCHEGMRKTRRCAISAAQRNLRERRKFNVGVNLRVMTM